MYIVQLDEQRYFTGVYSLVRSGGGVPNGISVHELPDMTNNKTTCWRWDTYEEDTVVQVPVKGEPVQVPVIDDETGEQKIGEDGQPMFETVEGEITYQPQTSKELVVGWVFDEEKYIQLQDDLLVKDLRAKRAKEFELIDKMQLPLYYNSLSEEQRQALADYRQAWLDAPENKQEPEMPECLQSLKTPL